MVKQLAYLRGHEPHWRCTIEQSTECLKPVEECLAKLFSAIRDTKDKEVSARRPFLKKPDFERSVREYQREK